MATLAVVTGTGRTTARRVSNILDYLNLGSRSAATAFAHQNGLA
jgi:DNA-binding NarL/FixJ family response regulator